MHRIGVRKERHFGHEVVMADGNTARLRSREETPMTVRKMILLAGVMGGLSACAMPAYVPAHDQSIEEAAGARLECKAISEGLTPAPGGFVAVAGNPRFVGAALGGYAIGGLIGAGIRQQHRVELYDDCMVAHGYQKATS
jgi:hypothetical protein